jgi:hypothetical protein
MASLVQARTVVLSPSAGENIPATRSMEVAAVEMRIRASGPGVFVGNPAVSASDGYEMNANQEYVFKLAPVQTVTGSSADLDVHVVNTSGSNVTLSWLVTATTA